MAAKETGWRVGTTQIGFDGVWSQPYDAVAVYHNGEVVKVYGSNYGSILGKLLAHIYILTHR